MKKVYFSTCVFFFCSALSWGQTWNLTSPVIVPSSFYSANISAAALHVPAGTKALYQAADVWKDFGAIVEYTVGNENISSQTLKAYASNGILHISSLRPGVALRIYDFAGRLVYTGIATAAEEYIPLHTRGFYIVAAGEQRVKTVVN